MFAYSKAFLLAAAAALTPAFAFAATINNSIGADQSFTFAEVVSPGEEVEFRFTVLEDLMIDNFSIAGTGTSGGADLGQIRFGFQRPADESFDFIQVEGDTSAALGFLSGRTWMMNDVFSVFIEDGIRNDVGITLSFTTESVAAIPLPATGLLLAPFLLAGGFAAARRRKTA